MADSDLSLEKLLFNLNTLSELNDGMSSDRDFDYVIKSSLYMVMGSFSASRGVIFGYDAAKNSYCPIVSKGLSGTEGLSVSFDGYAIKEFARAARPLDLKGPDPLIELLGQAKAVFEKIDARIVVFLTIKDEVLGLIAISGKFSGDGYTPYDMNFLSIMAQNISFSLHSQNLISRLMHKYTENRTLCDNLGRIYNDTIHAFATAIDAKDAYTQGHSNRVSSYCMAVSREMGWTEEEVEGIKVAGLMHDIGKIAVDKVIINKKGSLTDTELTEILSHPAVGYEILSKIRFPWTGISFMIRGHHEKYNGKGYPDGLKGEDIPAGSRIMTLVDSFDAMTTDRPYRKKLLFTDVMLEIKKQSGRQFDPEVVRSFTSVLMKEATGESDNLVTLPMLAEQLDYGAISGFLRNLGA